MKTVKYTYKYACNLLNKLPLFISISIWTLMALSALAGLYYLWAGEWIFGRLSGSDTHDDIVKLALTTVGGIGAVGYLVIKYQERQAEKRREEREIRSIEWGKERDKKEDERRGRIEYKEEEYRKRKEEKEENQIKSNELRAAINLLGSDKPSTRIAGVYELVEFADAHHEDSKQKIVNILCGYLRTNRSEDDGPVESTIIEQIRIHTQKAEEKTSWSNCKFNFQGATFLGEINLSCSILNGGTSFEDAKFRSKVFFNDTEFPDGISFARATFQEYSSFKSKFEGKSSFAATNFHSKVNFSSAEFKSKVSFNKSTFKNDVHFLKSVFQGKACFDHVEFQGEATFTIAEFKNEAWFMSGTFQQKGKFVDTKFQSLASFDNTRFNCETSFIGVNFNDQASFSKSIFRHIVDFTSAIFSSYIYFDHSLIAAMRLNGAKRSFEIDSNDAPIFNRTPLSGEINPFSLIRTSAAFQEAWKKLELIESKPNKVENPEPPIQP